MWLLEMIKWDDIDWQISHFKCRYKGNYREDCLKSAGRSQALDHNTPVESHSLSKIVTQTVAASYAVSQSSLVTILKILKRPNTNCQLRKNVQVTQPKQHAAPQPVVTKLVITTKVVPTKSHPNWKKDSMHYCWTYH